MVGAVIGNYQLIRKLGEGGMGAVYLGQHQLLGRRAAIKVLLPELSARPEIVSRFFNEARAVTSISDPGIVQVFDFGYHSDGSAFIVMEYLEGEPLDRRLPGRSRSTPRSRSRSQLTPAQYQTEIAKLRSALSRGLFTQVEYDRLDAELVACLKVK